MLSDLLGGGWAAQRRKIFISYHRARDQGYYDHFSRSFDLQLELVRDRSLDRVIDSEDVNYVMRRIREECLVGTSCTVVLCGAETPFRKYVDWEIKATLDKGHGLIGVSLPTNPADSFGRVVVPDRLYDNIQSSYAVWTNWDLLVSSPGNFIRMIETATSRPASLIENSRAMLRQNG